MPEIAAFCRLSWSNMSWAAANGGVTNGSLRGVWPSFPEIGRNRRFRPFSALFALFRRVRRAPGKSRKRRKKAFFLRYPWICSTPHLLNPHLLSGPLRLRVQSRSRTRLTIAASIAFLFRACFKGVWDTIAPLSRGWAPQAVENEAVEDSHLCLDAR